MKAIKIILDVAMYLLFVLLMGQHLTTSAMHEWLGIGLFGCFILHNIFNYKWYKALFKGKYTVMRCVQTTVNFLLIISFICCMLSAMLISGVVFKDFRLPGIEFGRKLHMISTAWCFILMNVHLGLHIRTPKKIAKKICFYAVTLTASVLGVYHFIIRRFYEELFLMTEFKWFDYDKTLIGYLLETICISIAFVMLTYGIKQLLRRIKK